MSRPLRRLLLLAVASSLALSGCNTLLHRKKPERVEPAPLPPAILLPPSLPTLPAPPPPPPPVQKSCVPKGLDPPPRYPDSDAALRAAAGAADRYQLMAAGRLLRQKRLEALERIIAGCR
jgi:hypothetical protein